MIKKYCIIGFVIITGLILVGALPARAAIDSDGDGLSDQEELTVYHTNPYNSDTDNDGYLDGPEVNSGNSPFAAGKKMSESDFDHDGISDGMEIIMGTNPARSDTDNDGFSDKIEIQHSYSPTSTLPIKMEKEIDVDLATQTLSYYFGGIKVGEFLISSGVKRMPTPKGEFKVLEKKPKVNYGGPGYWYPNTKWNLMFKRAKGGNFYIHGAYWHNKFGKPMSHGCVNVSYANMESFYDWAEVGTRVVIE